MKDPRNPIVRPVTCDGLVGYDRNDNFVAFAKLYGSGEPSIYSSTNTRDITGEMCPLCGKIWGPENTQAQFLDQIWSDAAMSSVHRSCFERALGFNEREKWVDALKEAEFDRSDIMTIKQIPNEYRGAWNTPWYVIELKGVKRAKGDPVMLKFGARKRVYNIEISGIEANGPTLLMKKFEAEETTKDIIDGGHGFLIHAWGMDKSKEYLTGIVASLKAMEAAYKEMTTDADAVPA